MDLRRARRVLLRGVRLRCPDCGQASIYHSFFRMKHHCSACGLIFEREQGYFVGAIYINVVVTESLLMLTFLVYLMFFSAGDQKVYTMLYVLAVAVPLIFFHHSRSLWLSIDHIIDPIRSRIELD
ncbi:MAG TPA: DUF983 domain-containing protein [Blastocatellia bacterium]|nr:DUF983 domain-containing protein [Blastocatellia bacterium]